MRIRIASIFLLFALLTGSASAGGIGFAERFALADTPGREGLLRELVAGTGDYFYYHCLHYQNTRNVAAFDQMIAAWDRSIDRDDPFSGGNGDPLAIRLREAVLRYSDEPEASLKTLRNYFDLDLEKVVPPPGAGIARSDLPSKLDPADIAPAAYLQAITGRREDPFGEDDTATVTAAWMIGTGQALPEGVTLRSLLKKIERPDIPNLLEAIQADVGTDNRGGFGSLPIHEQLLLPQLDTLAEGSPILLVIPKFVNAYLSKLRPSSMEPGTEAEQREAYLKRATGFTERLPPAMAAIHAHLLRHWLELDLQRGKVDRDRVMRYIQLPRRGSYMNRKYLDASEKSFAPGEIDLSKSTGLPKLPGGDEGLVRRLLLTLFQSDPDVEPFTRYINTAWLREISAEAQILAGKGDPEKLFSILGPVAYQRLLDRIDIEIAPGNPHQFAPEDEVAIKVDVKNVPRLTVKVFEINALNYFLKMRRDLDLSIDLDGLVATSEESYEYHSPPAERVSREFSFPQLEGKRGAWLIEFIGNGTSSRGLIRKGELHAIPRHTAAGHAFRVFDARRRQVETASIWLDGHEFHADQETGDVLVPYTTKPGRAPIIITDGEFARFDHFEHLAENYEFRAGIFVDRESLIAGNTAQLLVRPSLAINGAPADMALLDDVALTIESNDQDGTRSVQRIEAIKLSGTSELVHDFVVPERLESLLITLDAKVESLSTQERVSLSDHKEISINTIDRTDQIGAAHLLRSGDDYSIQVLGKNGEPLPGRDVQVSFFHRLFEQPQVLKFRSDKDGKVNLGGLAGISVIHTEIDSMLEIWELESRDRNHGAMGDYHLCAGEALSIAAPDPRNDLSWENYSLLEMRGGLPVRDWFQALSVDAEGALKIGGLPAGEYKLETPGGGSSTILVSHERPADILATADRFLEHSRSQPVLGMQIQDPVDGKLRLRVTNPSKHTRVHAVASHFVPRFAIAAPMLDQLDRSPRVASIRRAGCAYVSGREIGDEYRYILERREREKFPGNLLPRPGLILNPWALGESSSDELYGLGASMMFGSEAGRKRSGTDRGDGSGRATRHASDANLDFLAPGPRSFYNLKPDANGIVELDLEELGSARFIRAVAIDGDRLAGRSRALPPVRLETRDRRLQKRDQLDPLGRFVQTRTVEVIPAGGALTIDRSNGGRMQIYDDLGDAFALLNAIGGDTTLEKFSFILNWPQLSPEEKRHQYSDHACHELNLFLAHHDREFFDATIQPFLQNKRAKDFLDHYLLGDDLGIYLEESRLVRLNAAERALLARRLEGDAKRRTVQGLIDRHDSKPVDYRLQERLFRAALAGSDLSAGDALRSFDSAMASGDGIAPGASASGVEYVRRQLKSIIIPEIDFSEATIEEAVEFLRRQAQLLDPESGGVNIIVKGGDGTSPDDETTPINLQLTNVPLEDALKFTTELAGLKYRIDNGVIVIVPGYEEGGSLITQVYRVTPDFMQLDGGRAGSARELLSSIGVPFPDGTSATFLPATSELVVRNTASNHDLIAAFTDTLREDLPRDEFGTVTGDDPFGAPQGLFPLSAAADSDSDGDVGGDPFGDLDGAADPFGGGGGGGGFGSAGLLNRRANVRQFYRKLGDTEELAETHYYQLRIVDQTAGRIPVNAFWRDYAAWDGEGEFLSPHFPEASKNFTEIMLALAVLDLPFESDLPGLAQRGNELTVTAKGAAIVFAEQTRKAALEEGDVVVGQKFYPLAQPTSLDRGESVPNYIDADFVIGTGYGSHVVATNPTGRHLHFDLLRQLPHGAIPLTGSRMTQSSSVDLAPYSTKTLTMGFYFPMVGKFAQYPVQASSEGQVIASTPGKTFTVTREMGEVDVTSWDDLASRGSDAEVLAFLQRENLNYYPLDKIAWRMRDAQFFSDAIAILRERQIYHHGLYAFGLLHDHVHATRQFLLNSGAFLDEIGGVIESELLTVSPGGRRLYQHLEYEPLINARRHQLGDESRIANGQLRAQYERLLRLLTHKATADVDDRLSIVYYLLLQDRIDEAATVFDQIDAHQLATQLQYDYFRCYLCFYREQVAQAREIALKYSDHPVDRWRQRFAQVVSQADEIGGAVKVEVDDPRDRDQQQAKLAASSPVLGLEVEGSEVSITHRNIASARVNYYKMDLEFLFSANPFVDNDTERFRFLKPNHSQDVELVGEDGQTRVALPAEFQNDNVLVEVVGGGQSKARAHFANQLEVTVAGAYGRLQVRHAGSDRPLPKTYIKVYARLSDGAVKFYKDGYTDLRGKFDYASLSAEEPDIDQVDRFAILAMHEGFGAVVEEVAPPTGRPRANLVPQSKSGPGPALPDGAEGQGIRIKTE